MKVAMTETKLAQPAPPFLPVRNHTQHHSRPSRDESLLLITGYTRRLNKALHCFHSIQVKAVRYGTGLSQNALPIGSA